MVLIRSETSAGMSVAPAVHPTPKQGWSDMDHLKSVKPTCPECSETDLLQSLAAQAVGKISMHEFQKQVRRTVLEYALEQAHGNLSRAAKVLGITRQGLQNMIRRDGLTSTLQGYRAANVSVTERRPEPFVFQVVPPSARGNAMLLEPYVSAKASNT